MMSLSASFSLRYDPARGFMSATSDTALSFRPSTLASSSAEASRRPRMPPNRSMSARASSPVFLAGTAKERSISSTSRERPLPRHAALPGLRIFSIKYPSRCFLFTEEKAFFDYESLEELPRLVVNRGELHANEVCFAYPHYLAWYENLCAFVGEPHGALAP